MEEEQPKKKAPRNYHFNTSEKARLARSKRKAAPRRRIPEKRKTLVQVRKSLDLAKKGSDPRLTRAWFRMKIQKYLTMSHRDVIKERLNKENEAIDVWILSIISKGITSSNQYKLEFLIDQLFGKLAANLNVEKTNTSWATVVTDLKIDDNSSSTPQLTEEPAPVHQERPRLISGSKSDQDH